LNGIGERREEVEDMGEFSFEVIVKLLEKSA
jgi:hypothetical protein